MEEENVFKNSKTLKINRRKKYFNFFIDSDNLIRLGDRIQHSGLEYNTKHRIIFLRKNTISRLINKHYHKKNIFIFAPNFFLHFIRKK